MIEQKEVKIRLTVYSSAAFEFHVSECIITEKLFLLIPTLCTAQHSPPAVTQPLPETVHVREILSGYERVDLLSIEPTVCSAFGTRAD